MPKIIRLKTEELRRWRRNAQALVDDSGAFVREALPEEVLLLERVVGEARSRQISVRSTLKGVAIEALFDPALAGKNPNDPSPFDQRIAGRKLRPDRELFVEEKLAAHGECRLIAPNGRTLRVVRDPRLRTTAGEVRNVPDPERCICSKYSQREPGKHHLFCKYNEKAAPEQKGTRLVQAERQALLELVSKSELELVEAAPLDVGPTKPVIETTLEEAPKTAPAMPKPDDCVCKSFARQSGAPPSPEHHHPICEHFSAWEQLRAGRDEEWLVDIETGKSVRPAAVDEIARADDHERATGVRLVTIGDGEEKRAYGVLRRAAAS